MFTMMALPCLTLAVLVLSSRVGVSLEVQQREEMLSHLPDDTVRRTESAEQTFYAPSYFDSEEHINSPRLYDPITATARSYNYWWHDKEPKSYDVENPAEAPQHFYIEESTASPSSQPSASSFPTTAPVTSSPTLSPTVSPTSAPISSTSQSPSSSPTVDTLRNFLPICLSDSDGFFGTMTAVRIEVSFDYEVEIDPIVPGTMEDDVAPALEREVVNRLLPVFFSESCATVRVRRKLRGKRRLQILGVSALPRDEILDGEICQVEKVDQSNDCYSMKGGFALFVDSFQTQEMIANALQTIRKAMDEDVFVGVHPAIVKVHFIEREVPGLDVDDPPDIGVSNTDDDDDSGGDNSTLAYALIGAGVLLLAIISFLVLRRVLNEEDDEASEFSDDDDRSEFGPDSIDGTDDGSSACEKSNSSGSMSNAG